MASLLYGAGLRQIECLALRVKDVDFGYRQIMVRDGKGAQGSRDDAAGEPGAAAAGASGQACALLHRARPRGEAAATVWLPHALARKYPRARYEWGWQFVFPSGEALARSGQRRGCGGTTCIRDTLERAR